MKSVYMIQTEGNNTFPCIRLYAKRSDANAAFEKIENQWKSDERFSARSWKHDYREHEDYRYCVFFNSQSGKEMSVTLTLEEIR